MCRRFSNGLGELLQKNDVRDILHIPPHVDPIALLSIGYTEHYPQRPILETANWASRRELEPLIYQNTWGQK